MLRDATRKEYDIVKMKQHTVKKRLGDRSSRVIIIEWSYMGKVIATQTDRYLRSNSREPMSQTFQIDPEFLPAE